MSAKRTRRRSEAILAVLPFDNDSDDDAMEFFSDGVADEIMLILLRQSALKVIGRTSAFQFRGAKKCEAAAALKATHVLDGAVRRVGDHVRVNAQLIECASGVALWSARFDRGIGEAFELQDDIAKEVASALKHTLTRAERPAPAHRSCRVRSLSPRAPDMADAERHRGRAGRNAPGALCRARARFCARLGRARQRACVPATRATATCWARPCIRARWKPPNARSRSIPIARKLL
ncbi:MAG: hypothetical protein WDM79_08305 [Terricaulis sp.]